MKAATLALVVLLALAAAQLPSILPFARAAGPTPVGQIISGTLNPNANSTRQWQINQDFPDLIFHYKITGGSGPNDVVTFTIDDFAPWASLMGEGWEYCADPTNCPLSAGSYNVTVQADAGASAPVSFEIGFYLVPEPPVDFSGHIPANSAVRSSDFGVLESTGGNHTLILNATSGGYEFLDITGGGSESIANVTARTELNSTFAQGVRVLSVSAFAGQDVGWSVEIQGQPVPEFPSVTLPLVLGLALAVVLLARRSGRIAQRPHAQ